MRADSNGALLTHDIDISVSGILTAAEETIALSLTGISNVTWQLVGTWTATVIFEASNDNLNWIAIWASEAGVNTISQSVTANGIFRTTTAGFGYARVRCSAYTSGTIEITGMGSRGTSGIILNAALPAGDNNIGNVDIASGSVSITGAIDTELTTADLDTGAGTDTRAVVGLVGSASGGGALIPGSATDGLLVNLGANNDVTLTSTTITSLPASTNTLEVVGDVAHSAGAAGNPVLICGVAQNSDDTAPPNRVDAESDATRLATDWDGTLYTKPHGPQIWSYHDDDAAAVTTDGSVHAAPASGLSLYVTDIIFSIGAATASSIFLEEGSTKVLGPYYLEAIAGRGMAIHFQTPKKITAATELLVTNTGSILFSIDITGYTAQG